MLIVTGKEDREATYKRYFAGCILFLDHSTIPRQKGMLTIACLPSYTAVEQATSNDRTNTCEGTYTIKSAILSVYRSIKSIVVMEAGFIVVSYANRPLRFTPSLIIIIIPLLNLLPLLSNITRFIVGISLITSPAIPQILLSRGTSGMLSRAHGWENECC